jgi:hypothetical protein
MRVSLRQASSVEPARAERVEQHRAAPLLSPSGPCVILGAHLDPAGLAEPVRPAAATLFGPRGACLASENGPLFVCDTGHHRLLVWRRRPEADGTPADYVIGQPDFESEGRNAKGEPGLATLNVPTGVAVGRGVLAVADAWNHRVLLWHGHPQHDNQPADIVLGQAGFTANLPNRGLDLPRADTLNWCYGVAITDGRLMVADTGNRRVLIWERIPEANGAPADCVLGQRDFTCRDENAGRSIGSAGMRWPHGVATGGGALMVVDAGNNRVMVWRACPAANGAPCDFVLGQDGFAAQEHNRAAYYPDAGALNMPYGLAVQHDQLIVADTANSRLLGYPLSRLTMGAAATHLAGQRSFADKGDNRWEPPARDSLCWPYGLSACSGTAVIADSGNNRVSLWEAA